MRGNIVSITPYPFRDPYLPANVRTIDLNSRLTLPEKISQLGYNVAAIEHLGIAAYSYWNEALHGLAASGWEKLVHSLFRSGFIISYYLSIWC